MAKGKNLNDWQTYKRLLKYMRGTRKVVLLLIFCMVLEALFTVVTIFSIKPIIELLLNNRVVDSSQLHAVQPMMLEAMVNADTRTAALKGRGSLETAQSGDRLRDRLRANVDTRNKLVAMDLSETTAPGAEAWSALMAGRLIAEQRRVPLQVVLPAEFEAPDFLKTPSEFFTLLRPTDAAAQEVTALAAQVSMPVPKAAGTGPIQRLKKSAVSAFRPFLLSVERYAQQSQANKFHVLGFIIGAMLFSAFMMTVCSFGVGFISSYLAALTVNRLRNHTYSHMLGLDLHYFNSHSTGNLMSTVMQDVQMVASSIDILFGSVLKTPITVGTLVVAMFLVSPQLTLFTFLVVPFIIAMVFVIARRVRKISRRIQESRGIITGMMQETFTGVRVVKAFNTEPWESERFRKETRLAFKRGLKNTIAEELGTSLTQLLGAVTVASVVLAGGYFILRPPHAMSGSDFVLFIGLVTQVFRPLKNVSRTTGKIQRGLAGCDRVFAALDTVPHLVDAPGAVPAVAPQRSIEFRDVHFGYALGKEPVLRGISLTVPVGRAVALVGETGSGKSTLVNLLPRFFDPTKGAVLWDGADLRTLQVKSLREQISLITQDVILFDSTIAENIAYGHTREVTRDEVVAAARAANAHDFITRNLANGYDTQVGARGVRLSGGERQRIAIARAILKDAPVMILDEATSALDSETEALIQEALTRVMKGRTVFVIAHRLSTIQNCDEICVIDQGVFVERGTHDELLRRGGQYARYYNIQFGKQKAGEPASV